jgi:hypothetical protein
MVIEPTKASMQSNLERREYWTVNINVTAKEEFLAQLRIRGVEEALCILV